MKEFIKKDTNETVQVLIPPTPRHPDTDCAISDEILARFTPVFRGGSIRYVYYLPGNIGQVADKEDETMTSSDQIPDTRPGNYYVSIVDGPKYALLLGPFVDDHQAALDAVQSVRDKAFELNPAQATFAGFGTCRVSDYSKPGALNDHITISKTGG